MKTWDSEMAEDANMREDIREALINNGVSFLDDGCNITMYRDGRMIKVSYGAIEVLILSILSGRHTIEDIFNKGGE